jgi:hypothetical protein
LTSAGFIPLYDYSNCCSGVKSEAAIFGTPRDPQIGSTKESEDKAAKEESAKKGELADKAKAEGEKKEAKKEGGDAKKEGGDAKKEGREKKEGDFVPPELAGAPAAAAI